MDGPLAPPARLAVVGAGWAGLAAAVDLVGRGHRVTVMDMAPRAGGRAASVDSDGLVLDNGQHILIGAYAQTLALMRAVGADVERLLWRGPLALAFPDGDGLRLPPGPAALAFGRAVWGCGRWSTSDKLRLLAAAAGWMGRGFECAPGLTVAAWSSGLPRRVRADLVDPLCVAALNTPPAEASAQVLLRVLKDALFGGPGAADLLLPRAPLRDLLPRPAWQWLHAHGADLRLGSRVMQLDAHAQGGWMLDQERFDGVVLAVSAREASRLAAPIDPAWAACAGALRYEPIATVIVQADGLRLPAPMLALESPIDDAPAQFVFDHGQLHGPPGRMVFVASAAAAWLDRGRDALGQAVLAQAGAELRRLGWPADARILSVVAERRATFRCTPGLQRPRASIAAGLWAAGDHVDGPYPSTLEGAVRAGRRAATGLLGDWAVQAGTATITAG